MAEEAVMPEARDQMPAALGRGHLRACHADREQVIGVLKTAFVQGRLGKDELNARVGQAWLRGPMRTWPRSPPTCPPGSLQQSPRTSPPGPAHHCRCGPLPPLCAWVRC